MAARNRVKLAKAGVRASFPRLVSHYRRFRVRRFDPAATRSAALALSLFWACSLFAQSEKIPAEMIERASHESAVPVLIGLKVPWQREATLSEDAIGRQRQAIHSVQDQLLSELSGTVYRIVRRYDVIPAIALEVGADALPVLANSTHVTNVLPDKPAQASEASEEPPAADGSTSVGIVPLELFAEAARHGTVLVLVGVKAPWAPEEWLNAKLISAQRKAIEAAQNYLLTELTDTDYRVTRRYDQIPAIALEVGLDALATLSQSAAATSVLADRPPSTTK